VFPSDGKTWRFLALAAGVCLLFVLAFLFIWKPNVGEARPADAGVTSTSGGDSQVGNNDGAAADRVSADSAGPVAIASAEVVLRGQAENEAMLRRHERALQTLGLPLVSGPKPRRPLAKEPLVQPPGQEHQLLVKFQDNLLARAAFDGALVISGDRVDPRLLDVIRQHGLRFGPNHTAGEDDLARLEAEALASTREQPADLGGMLLVAPAQPDKEAIWAAANALQALGVTEFVTISSLDQPPPPPLPYDIEPPSELLSAAQTYRGEAGINIDEAWRLFGAKGAGVRVTDCEYKFNPNHEDMSGLVSTQPGASAYFSDFGDDHGTAVLGMLVAAENNYGMTGMVPLADAYFYGDLATVNGVRQTRSACITAALAASARGDVVLLEMQTRGAGWTTGDDRYVPAEYDLAVWTAVKTGTDAGKHVVAAAGNGAQNLDDSVHDAYRNRGDSGSIVVGAGNTARARRSFSTYGTRVNLQGWGGSVATLGYGGYRTYGGDHNQKYTQTFSGTSSASPIVTAAVVAIESVARERLDRSLTPAEMRQLLVQTGKPQSGDLSENIGPLPDTPAALASLLGIALNYVVDFEAPTKPGYASADVSLNGLLWNLTEVLIGGLEADYKIGFQSARFRGYGSSAMTMLEDTDSGIGAISFSHRRYGSDAQIEWIVEFSTNGGVSWNLAGRFTSGPSPTTFVAAVNSVSRGRVRIRAGAAGESNRRMNIDDLVVTAYPPAGVPAVSVQGNLPGFSSVYGSPSTTVGYFTVAGANLSESIQIQPPDGFEVSLSPGGATGFAPTQTISGSGAVEPRTVFVRLAAGQPAGFYSGDIICASAAATASLEVPLSEVRRKALSVKADDLNKAFGETLVLGPGQTAFSASGLIGSEVIGSITLVASAGIGLYDAVGTYELVPSSATGGTFDPESYEIDYLPGALKVVGQTFADWSAGLSNPAPEADLDGDGLPNLVEYFMGLDPVDSSSGWILRPDLDREGEISVEYRRSKSIENVSGGIQWKSSLIDGTAWSSDGVRDEALSDLGSYELRRASVPLLPGETQKFLRLKAQH
jgi:hypothetical protein